MERMHKGGVRGMKNITCKKAILLVMKNRKSLLTAEQISVLIRAKLNRHFQVNTIIKDINAIAKNSFYEVKKMRLVKPDYRVMRYNIKEVEV